MRGNIGRWIGSAGGVALAIVAVFGMGEAGAAIYVDKVDATSVPPPPPAIQPAPVQAPAPAPSAAPESVPAIPPALARSKAVSIDIREGDRLRVGSYAEIRLTSPTAGLIVLFNVDPSGRAQQIYPSRALPAPGANPQVARIEAGKTLSIPSAVQRDQGIRLAIRPPEGANRLRAVVVPVGRSVEDAIRAHGAGDVIDDLDRVVATLVETALAGAAGPGSEAFAFAERVYEIVP